MSNYLPGADPFFFPGNRVGCLLIHGFTGTPYEMRGLGERLAQQGYTVSGPALAGHATCLADMYQTRWPDWYGTVTNAYDQLVRHCDAIFPIGLSLGALLALHLSAHCRVTGVVAVAPPYGITHPLIRLFRILPFLTALVPQVNKSPDGDDTQDPEVRLNHPSYEAFPVRCAESMINHLLPHLRTELPQISAPALFIQARQDRAISPDSIDRCYERISSKDKQKVWLEKGGHLVLEDYAKEQAFARIQEFIRAHIPPVTSA